MTRTELYAERLQKSAALFVLFFGVLGLLGWQFGIEFLKTLPPGKIAMNPLTAICFIASAFGLLGLWSNRHLLAKTLGILTAALAASRLLGIVGPDLELDRILYPSSLATNRMAPNTALAFTCVGLALVCSRHRSATIRRFADYLNAVVLMISLLALTGYLYGAEALYGVASFIPMALNTGIAFFVLSLGLFCDRRNEGFVQVLIAEHLGGAIARRLLPIVVLVPLILGGFRIYGQRAGWYTFEFGAAMLVVTTVFALLVLTWRLAHQLGEMDLAFKEKSRELESVLTSNNAALERKIEDRVGELTDARSQIEQLQKLDAVGRLAGGIAHDFNNILGAILMYCDLITRNLGRMEAITESVSQIQKATERGAALSKQLLIFSRKKVVEHQAIHLNQLLKDHFKMLERLIGENIEIEFRLSDRIPMISGDPGQLEQVVMNLIINARDAMPDGGKITVETRREDLTENFASSHLTSKLGPHVLLSITDTGCGMDEATKSRIFEPFFTTKQVGKGTGLGLSTVYGIVKSVEGTIWVYSEPGHGTVFKIYIPAIGVELAKPKVEVPTATLEGTETILVVEDEEALRSLYGEALKELGYDVILAENGSKAWEIFDRDAQNIDLIVTDMIMPGLGGTELLKKAIEKMPDVKVLCMSGYPGETEDIPFNTGHIGYIQKPFNTTQLLTRIRSLLGGG